MPAKRWRHQDWEPYGDEEPFCVSRGPFYVLIRIFRLLCAALKGEQVQATLRRREGEAKYE